MPVTHVPAQPAVTKIVEVSPATPEKYVLELTLHQALCLAALSGTTAALNDDGGLWQALCNHPLYQAYRDEREKARDEDRAPFFKDLTGSDDAPDDAVPPGHIRALRTVEGDAWTVGKVYTVDMSRSRARQLGLHGVVDLYPGVVVDDDGDERVYFPRDFEPI